MKNVAAQENIFVLKNRRDPAPNVCSLEFAPAEGEMFAFESGQYVTLYFPDDRFGWQGKSYSIVSDPGASDGNIPTFSVAIKKMGQFSGALHALRVGDKVKVEGPTGYFSIDSEMGDIVMLAAGIGIAPFLSMLRSLAREGQLEKKRVFLFYSNKTLADIAFRAELNALAVAHPNLKIIHALTWQTRQTQQSGHDPTHEYGRITLDMLMKYLKPPNTASPPRARSASPPKLTKQFHYFICGSISFVNDFWKALKDAGIAEDHLVTEAFY